MVTKGIVLGHIISEEGIQVDKVIANLLIPRSIRYERSFLGHASFYRRFIKNSSTISQPLCSLLAKDTPFEWTTNFQDSFDKLKEYLTTTPII